MRIEAQPIPKVLRHLTYEPDKRRLAEQEIGGLLVLSAHGSTLQYEGARGIKCSTRLISLSATVPGRYRCGFFTPPVAGALLRAALETGTFFGALPPVDLKAVCFVLRRHASAYFSTVRLWKLTWPSSLACSLAALLCTVGYGVMMTNTDGR